MTAMIVLFGLIGFLVGIGLIESLAHRKNLARIPIRIHVNGTRGKSSVTRLIAAGLRGAGLRTVAKTTGTLPRLIHPDGREFPIDRPSRPNVIEQRRVIQEAARLEAEAVVVECMALQPWLQWICESKFIRATHGVITNARADHLDVMGPDEVHVAQALANMTPQSGVLITAEREHGGIFKQAAEDRKSRFVPITEADVLQVSEEEMSRFAYTEHRENVALALRVCAEVGVNRALALEGMFLAMPDPGATITYDLDFWGRSIRFVSAFAANDPISTEHIWNRSLQRYPDAEKRIALFNCRSDRADRSRQLAQACVRWPAADHYVLTGTGTRAFVRSAARAGLDLRTLRVAEAESPAELFEILIELADRSGLIVGMGNIGDNGLEIARFFRNRERLFPRTRPRSDSRSHKIEQPQTGPAQMQPLGLGALDLAPSSNGKLKM